MNMLQRDEDHFARCYPDAAAFMRAAALRYEAYVIARTRARTTYETVRLKEILHAPACREPWFVIQLRGDGVENIDAFLLGAGL